MHLPESKRPEPSEWRPSGCRPPPENRKRDAPHDQRQAGGGGRREGEIRERSFSSFRGSVAISAFTPRLPLIALAAGVLLEHFAGTLRQPACPGAPQLRRHP